VAYADPAPRHRALPRATVHPRKRRLARIGLIALVLMSATAAFGHIASLTLDNAWRDSDIEIASEAIASGRADGLTAARDHSVDVLSQRDDDQEALGLAALSDQLLRHWFGDELEEPTLVDDPQTPMVAVAATYQALHETGLDGMVAQLDAWGEAMWRDAPGLHAWALGLTARAGGD